MTITVTRPVHFRARGHGRRVASTKPSPLAAVPDRVPRVARLMALAIVLDRRLRAGEFRSISEMARRFGVSQPRMTQILNLTLLAAHVQEELLLGQEAGCGAKSPTEHGLRLLVAECSWGLQDRIRSSIGC